MPCFPFALPRPYKASRRGHKALAPSALVGAAVALYAQTMRPEAPAIAVQDLVKTYKGVSAVDGISFAVPRGSILGLLGGNGAGKTTTIAVIMGLILPTSGTATVLGADMARERHKVLHRLNFQSPYVELPKRLTVRQNLKIFGALYNVRPLKTRIEELSAELDLTEFIDRQSGQLSAGQKTRVALAKALVNNPDVLLLDEPTASLDPDTADWVRSHLERFRRERRATILLASHNMPEVERLCDDVVMMRAGKIVDRGAPAELIARYGRESMEEVFLDVARQRGRETAK
jgi:ABC-2 type transport system ATP-binding protein